MRQRDRVRLLGGPYRPPAVSKGNLATCLYRDAEVVITSWTDARIPWPRCRAVGTRGGSGLLVNDELARAVRTESAAAMQFWWGVSPNAVKAWRRAFGVDRKDNPGTRRLIAEASAMGAAKVRGKPLPADQVELRRQTNRRLGLHRNLILGYHGQPWTADELALLGTIPDEDLAGRIGKTRSAVRAMRWRLGIDAAELSQRG